MGYGDGLTRCKVSLKINDSKTKTPTFEQQLRPRVHYADANQKARDKVSTLLLESKISEGLTFPYRINVPIYSNK